VGSLAIRRMRRRLEGVANASGEPASHHHRGRTAEQRAARRDLDGGRAPDPGVGAETTPARAHEVKREISWRIERRFVPIPLQVDVASL
jgi:hypothetical protein